MMRYVQRLFQRWYIRYLGMYVDQKPIHDFFVILEEPFIFQESFLCYKSPLIMHDTIMTSSNFISKRQRNHIMMISVQGSFSATSGNFLTSTDTSLLLIMIFFLYIILNISSREMPLIEPIIPK